MPSSAEVPDPTDWIGTPLSSLSTLESALQCHVCKELFTTPMITSCSHTFCSLCIRRCLSQDGRCPACRSGDQESKLRRNWAMEECVNVYEKQRGDLLEFARRIAKEAREKAISGDRTEGRAPKRRRIQPSNSNGVGTTSDVRTRATRATRSQSHMGLETNQESRERSYVEDSEDDGSRYDDEEEMDAPTGWPSADPDDGLVPCPMCKKRMKEEAVFLHLDQCDGRDQSMVEKDDRTQNSTKPASVAYSVPSPTKARQRLGALNYTLLSETALRKKLFELGIASHGSKTSMQRRHIEWMNLWNASCDSSKPMTKRELLRELEIWERTQGRQSANAQGPSGVMAKDFDADSWTRSNKSDFAALINLAKEKARKPGTGPSQPKNEGLKGESHAPPPSPPPNLQPVVDGGPRSSPCGTVVDLTSPTKPLAELQQQQQQNEGSQVNGVAA